MNEDALTQLMEMMAGKIRLLAVVKRPPNEYSKAIPVLPFYLHDTEAELKAKIISGGIGVVIQMGGVKFGIQQAVATVHVRVIESVVNNMGRLGSNVTSQRLAWAIATLFVQEPLDPWQPVETIELNEPVQYEDNELERKLTFTIKCHLTPIN